MGRIISQLLILFAFIICGFVIGKTKKISIERSNILSVLLVYILLPSKIFLNFSQRCTIPYLKANCSTLLISTAILLVLVLVSRLMASGMTKDVYERRVYRYSFAISNYAYLGYGFVESALGEQALTDMIFFCIPFAFYTYTFGYSLLTQKDGFLKKLINPMIISIALGVLFGACGISLPSFITTALSCASGCVGPLSMLLTGLVIAAFSAKELLPKKDTYIFCAIRLICIPAFIFLICVCLNRLNILPDAIYPAAVVMGCMPCGLNTIVFPMLVGKDCRMGARFVLLSHILSMITIPIWMWILI